MGISEGLIGHWELGSDTNDHSGTGQSTRATDVELGHEGPGGQVGTAAKFNGKTSVLEVAEHHSLDFAYSDLALTAWVRLDDDNPDVVGDIISNFDPDSRKGFQLGIVTNTGVTSTAQPNHRHLQFGIDDAQLDPAWTDCGRPGNCIKVGALTVSKGMLYAGSLETQPEEMGHLWRYDGGQKWTDLGNPVGCNIFNSIAEYEGGLYCGIGRYNCSGSGLGATNNMTPGGQVYRFESGEWIYCGHPGGEDAVPDEEQVSGYHTGKADDAISLTVFRGELYCTSNHRLGVFKFEGGENWKHIGLDRRILSFTIYKGDLYALINGGPVYRYEGGEDWTYCGDPETSTQTYGAVTHQGKLYVGTWPEGEVYRYDGGEIWVKVDRVACEREIMAMVSYNGKAYVGGLPMANVYRMDREGFSYVGNLDSSPVVMRRVWSMAVYDGKLYGGTLPSGHMLSIEAGKVVTGDRVFPAGWHHLAAVKEGGRLKVYLDGDLYGNSSPFAPNQYDLTTSAPLRIGFGSYEYFRGRMSNVRLYNRALGAREIYELSDTAI